MQQSHSDTKSAGKPKSLYRELMMALIVLMSSVSVMFSVLNYFYTRHEAVSLYQSKLSDEYSAYLRQSLEWPLWTLDDELIVKIGDAFTSNAEVSMLIIRDDVNRTIYNQSSKLEHNQIKRVVDINHNGHHIGSVEVGISLEAFENRERRLLFTSITSTLLLIAVIVFATRMLLRRLLGKPFDNLVRVIGNVADGHYNQLELTGTFEEFVPILSSFNAMSEAVNSRESSLRSSEERLKLATSAGGIGIWDWNITSNELAWDDSMYSLYGIGKEDFSGAYDAWVRNLHPDDRQFTEGEIQAALKNEREYAPEFRIVRPDGKLRKIKASSKTFFDSQGNALRMIGINFDITDIKQAEEDLRRYKDHLEEDIQQRTTDLVLARNAAEAANQAKSIFLANMSHELRTPLNAILGFSNMMRKDPLLQESQRQNLDIINRSGEHLLTLINDVLEMAKIEAGRVQLENAPFDLGGMVRDVTDMMQIRAQEKGLQMLIDQDSRFPRYVAGDETRLRQILINLIGNAIKYTHQGGVTLRLGTKQNKFSHLLIEVEDSGPGITPEDQQRIFEPFVQLGEQAESKGTGLGLTITRQFVQMMGGNITLESTFGKGSLFRVDLPLNEVTEVVIAQPKQVENGEVVGLAPGQPEYRILIVEDQRDNQLLLTKLMESVGLQVKVAENGAKGIELFQSWHPHLIWMDRRMPVMDGLEATRRIRGLPGGKEVKIIAVTASAFVEQRTEMLDVGMDDFVRKPYRSNEIYERLLKHLGVRYIYKGVLEPEQPTIALTPEMLDVLPDGLRNDLWQALENLDSKRIVLVIQQVGAYDKPLQKTLTDLAEHFDYPTILKALRSAR